MRKVPAVVVGIGLFLSVLGDGGVAGAAPVQATATEFKDMSIHWAKSAIESAVNSGVVRGYPDGTFKPDANVTRAEFLAIVTRASKLPDLNVQGQFEDVPNSHWAVDAVNKGIGMGIINPDDYGNTFEPEKALTRSEMVKWLVDGLVAGDPSFAQALVDTEETLLPFTEFYRDGFLAEEIPYIAVARGIGLVGGFPDGSFGPDRTTTRAEVVVLLERYLGVEGTKAEDYKALNELREVGTTGTNLQTIANATWSKGFDLKEAPFYKLFNTQIEGGNGAGTVVVYHYIVVETINPTSVYADMFLPKDYGGREGSYAVFIDTSFTAARDLSEIKTYKDSVSYLTGNRVVSDLPMKYGYKTLPNRYAHTEEYSTVSEFFKQGVERNMWVRTGTAKGWRVSAITNDGKVYGYSIPLN